MALLYMEGFDHYGDVADVNRFWSAQNDANVTLATGRTSGKALEIGAVSRRQYLNFPLTVTIVVGFACKYAAGGTNPISIREIAGFMANGSDQLDIILNTTGTLGIRRGSTVLGTSTATMSTSWSYVEVKVLFSQTVGTIDMQINGASEISDTSLDTMQTTIVGATSFYIDGDGAADPTFDDIYILDTTGSDNTDFLGDVTVETLYPTGAGNSTDWSPSAGANWENVDDGASPDDDSTYNSETTAADHDSYVMGDISQNVDTVFGVSVINHCRKEEAGFREVACMFREGGGDIFGTAQAMSTDFRYQAEIFENDQGGSDWTETTVNAMEAGIRLDT